MLERLSVLRDPLRVLVPPALPIRAAPDYTVYRENDVYYAQDEKGVIRFENTVFQALLNDVITTVNEAGGGIILLKRGTYQMSSWETYGPIVLKSNVWLKGEGMRLTKIISPLDVRTWRGFIENEHYAPSTIVDENIRVSDLELDGQWGKGNGGYWGPGDPRNRYPCAMNFWGIKNCLFERLYMHHHFNYGIRVRGDVNLKISEKVIIKDCFCEYTGFNLQQFEGENTGGVRDCLCINCYIRKGDTGFSTMSGKNIAFIGCVAVDNWFDISEIDPEQVVYGNNWSGLGVEGTATDYSENVVVANCVFGGGGQVTGCGAHHSYNVAFIGNTVFECADVGMDTADTAHFISIIGNTIRKCKKGIRIYGTDTVVQGNAIIGDPATYPAGSGIILSSAAKRCLVSNNVISDPGENGIFCSVNLTELFIRGNILRASDPAYMDYAIAVRAGTNNVEIVGNRIDNVRSGVWLESGVLARIYIGENWLTNIVVDPIYDPDGVAIKRRNVGFITENSGIATGTGVEQAIPHGCDFTPTEANVILSNIDSGANPYLSTPPDATNLYITATSGSRYRWEVKMYP